MFWSVKELVKKRQEIQVRGRKRKRGSDPHGSGRQGTVKRRRYSRTGV